jgi:uncharacterized surface protein with fasciclin (FAS1) repeats
MWRVDLRKPQRINDFVCVQDAPEAFLINAALASTTPLATQFTILAPNDAAFADSLPSGLTTSQLFSVRHTAG